VSKLRYLHCIDFGCASGVEFLPLRHVRAKSLVGKHRTVEPGFDGKLPVCLLADWARLVLGPMTALFPVPSRGMQASIDISPCFELFDTGPREELGHRTGNGFAVSPFWL
jgi:hypothetical protein